MNTLEKDSPPPTSEVILLFLIYSSLLLFLLHPNTAAVASCCHIFALSTFFRFSLKLEIDTAVSAALQYYYNKISKRK